jgi:hypothetical protein
MPPAANRLEYIKGSVLGDLEFPIHNRGHPNPHGVCSTVGLGIGNGHCLQQEGITSAPKWCRSSYLREFDRHG